MRIASSGERGSGRSGWHWKMKDPIVKYPLGVEAPTRVDHADWQENANEDGRTSPMLDAGEREDENEETDER